MAIFRAKCDLVYGEKGKMEVLRKSKLDCTVGRPDMPSRGLDWWRCGYLRGGVYLGKRRRPRERPTTCPCLLNISNTAVTMEPATKTCITAFRKTDFTEWSRLFHAYIDFYKSSIPEAQYQATFDRLIDPQRDLYGLALRSATDENKLFGIAHYYPHQTPWAEKQIMHLNGM